MQDITSWNRKCRILVPSAIYYLTDLIPNTFLHTASLVGHLTSRAAVRNRRHSCYWPHFPSPAALSFVPLTLGLETALCLVSRLYLVYSSE